jgi:hypothetical protein
VEDRDARIVASAQATGKHYELFNFRKLARRTVCVGRSVAPYCEPQPGDYS